MATSTTSDEHANLLENFIDNVRAALAQIEEGETKKQNPKDFNPDVYWKKFGDVFKALSHEGTKLTMAFSSPPAPTPEALEGLLGSFEKAVQALVSFYYTLPKRQGITLRKVVRKSVMRCLESVIILVENLKQGNAGNSEQLQSTGALWQEVDNFSSIPRDNKSALLEVLKRNMHLVSDALQELDQALEIDGEDEGIEEFLGNSQQNHGNNASSWSDRDKDIIVSCLPLIKASKSILKKTHAAVRLNGRCSSEEEISQLDDLGDYIESMSPKVDEFATSLYPPLKGPNVLQYILIMGKTRLITTLFLLPAYKYISDLHIMDRSQWVAVLVGGGSSQIEHHFAWFSKVIDEGLDYSTESDEKAVPYNSSGRSQMAGFSDESKYPQLDQIKDVDTWLIVLQNSVHKPLIYLVMRH